VQTDHFGQGPPQEAGAFGVRQNMTFGIATQNRYGQTCFARQLSVGVLLLRCSEEFNGHQPQFKVLGVSAHGIISIIQQRGNLKQQ